MGRFLVRAGLVVSALAVWALLAGSAGWIDADPADAWGTTILKSGLACLALGLIVRGIAPVRRAFEGGRCSRCGKPTDRGHAYCQDHLKQVIEEIRDHTPETSANGSSDRS